MQKDFTTMAQDAPKEATEQDIQEIGYSSEEFEELGMPGGDDVESIKKRFMVLFEESGLLEMFKQPAQLQEFTKQLNMLATDLSQGNVAKAQENPLFKLLEKTMEESGVLGQLGEGEMPQQAKAEPAATKDFASMMPPSGGGLPGR